MNRAGDQEHLLNDVLADAMPESLREDLLAHTLRLLRRRQRSRKMRRTAGTLAVLLALGLLVWPRLHYPEVQSMTPRPYVLVRTEPLPNADIVTTVPLKQSGRVVSSPMVSVISTATAPHLAHEIDDAGLLSLAAPNPVVFGAFGTALGRVGICEHDGCTE